MESIMEEVNEDTIIQEEDQEEEMENNFIVFLGGQDDFNIGIADTKLCEFKHDELISMTVWHSHSFVLTDKSDVLVFGNFADLLNPDAINESNAEFIKLPHFDDSKII